MHGIHCHVDNTHADSGSLNAFESCSARTRDKSATMHTRRTTIRVGVDASATTSLFVETSNTRVLRLVLRDNAHIFYGYGEILEYRVWKEIGLSINRDQLSISPYYNNFGWKGKLVEEMEKKTKRTIFIVFNFYSNRLFNSVVSNYNMFTWKLFLEFH